MQPRDTKRILAVVVAGSLILGAVIWLSASSRAVAPTSGLPVTAISATAALETHEMPPTVVTMLGVPEVIVSAAPEPDSISEGDKTSITPARMHAPTQAGPVHPTKEAARQAPAPNNNLAKILAGQIAPPSPAQKPTAPPSKR